MANNIKNILVLLFPSKKINYTSIFLFILGLISGSLFLCILNINDKNYIVNKITSFITFINESKINYQDLFLNSILINFIYVFTSFIFGLSVLGIIIILFLILLKGFVFGFYLSSFILTYSYKGIILSFLYSLFVEFINIISLLIMSTMGITFSFIIIRILFTKKVINYRNYLKNYILVFIFLLLGIIISSSLEVFVFPSLLKLIIKLFV